MIAYIDAHRDQFGVELICRVLRAAIPGFLTSRGYRAARIRPPSDREIRDEQLIADLREVHQKNYSVYGVNKMHRAMKRKGWVVGREQTRRLMRKAGLRGVQRGKPVFTTVTDPAAARPADLVNRQFRAPAPNRLWVADLKCRRRHFRSYADPRNMPMVSAMVQANGGVEMQKVGIVA
jgi:hypothetical protein